ncbi:Uncharacterised protein [Vibrio cholerae]|nr:Uncharacterised protein [Vibrio cholerae]
MVNSLRWLSARRSKRVSSSTFSPTKPKSTTPSMISPGMSSSRTNNRSIGIFSE